VRVAPVKPGIYQLIVIDQHVEIKGHKWTKRQGRDRNRPLGLVPQVAQGQ